jgi:sugar lactone lactonase YvrE
MFIKFWLRSLKSLSRLPGRTNPTRSGSRRAPHPFRPCCESLEKRELLSGIVQPPLISGWTVASGGDESIRTTLGNVINPVQGNTYLALLATDNLSVGKTSGNTSTVGFSDPNYSHDNRLATAGTILTSQTFTANAGATLSFSFNYLTQEIPGSDYDFAQGQILDGSGRFLSTVFTADSFSSSLSSVSGASGFSYQTGWQSATASFGTTGTYQLRFVATNTGDQVVESGLALDGIPSLFPQATPSISVTDASGVYNGSAFAASGSVTDAQSDNLGTPAFSYYSGTYSSVTALNTAIQQGQTSQLAKAPKDVGSYTVLASYAGSASYAAASAVAPFTITSAPLTISAVTDSKTYDGGTVSSQTPTVGALFGTDTVTGLSQAFTSKDVLGTNGSTLVVTGYTVNDGDGGKDYTVSTQNASGAITPAALTVNVADAVKTYGQDDSGLGPITTFVSGLNTPQGLAFDSSGNLYVANYESGTVTEVNTAGATAIFASGFTHPEGLAFDKAGNLYVANGDNAGTVSEVSPSGVVTTFADYNTGLYYPKGLAFDGSGNLYAADIAFTTVTKLPPGGEAGNFDYGFGNYNQWGLAFDGAGNLYIANPYNGAVSEVAAGGKVSTFATGFHDPEGLAFDSKGNLYVANTGNDTVTMVTPGGVVSTLVSTGLDQPVDLAFDGGGNLYISNAGDSTITRVGAAALTGNVSGIFYGDPITVTYSSHGSAARAAVSGNPYTINASLDDGGTGALNNYTVTVNTGKLTVNPAPLTVNVADAAKNYGQDDSASLTGAVSGVVNDDPITAAYTSDGSAASASVSGSPYTIKASLSDNGTGALNNYTFTVNTGKLTVNPAPLTVNVADAAKNYGQDDSASLTGAVSGVVNSDPITVTYSSDGSAARASVSGSPYTINASLDDGGTGALNNYTVTANTGKLTVSKAKPVVNLPNITGIYSGSAFTASATVPGVEDPSLTYTYYAGALTAAQIATATPLDGAPVNAGACTVVASFAGTTNYFPASSTAFITIAPVISNVLLGHDLNTTTVPFQDSIGFVDPDPTFTVQVDYNDQGFAPGAQLQPLPSAQINTAQGTFTLSHSFTANGLYTVTVVLSDSIGPSVTETFTVSVGVNPDSVDPNTVVQNTVQPGQTTTVSLPGGLQVGLTAASDSTTPATFQFALYTSNPVPQVALPIQAVETFDIQVDHPAADDVFTFRFKPDNSAGPFYLYYLNTKTNTYLDCRTFT